MKKSIKLTLSVLAAAALTLSLSACLRQNITPSGGGTEPSVSDTYHTVKFDTGVSGINIKDQSVGTGQTIFSPPIVIYREGYYHLGWCIDGESELFDFSSPITSDMTFTAVWEREPEGHIFDSMTAVSVIHDGTAGASAFAMNTATKISQSNYMGVKLYSHTDAPKAGYHEIVIGNTDREISKAAYRELEALVGGDEETLAYLVYSDGKSIALAYTGIEGELALHLIKEIFYANYIKESLRLTAGVYDSYAETLDDYYLRLDKENLAKDWRLLENYLTNDIGADAAAEFVSALKDLYSLYKPEMIDWYAKLYDPKVGGYYYSNSARDNATVTYQGTTYPLLPDIESTSQALNFITSSAMAVRYADVLPSFMREQIVSFIIGTQDVNGYFYHPQWPKEMTDSKTSRRSRDLSKGESVLRAFGAQPLYTTPNGMQGSTVAPASRLTIPLRSSNISLLSSIIPTADVANGHLTDKATFEAYLASLDIKNRSYHVGNELTSQSGEIIARDKQLAEEGASYRLMDILISWLNENQNPNTGHWHHTDNYYGVNGLLKISGIYNDAKVPMPHAKEASRSAIRAITSDEPMGAVVDLYNTWFSIENIVNNIRKYGSNEDKAYADRMVSELRISAPSAIRKSREKIAVFQKADGSFSYNPNNSSNTSQGMPVAIYGTNEGDINATGISSTGLISYIMGALELRSYKPALFGKTELRRYIDIIKASNAEAEKMKPLDISGYSKISFDNGELPESVTTSFYSQGSVSVTDKELVFTTVSGGNDSLFFTPAGDRGNAVIFNADITLSQISGSDTLFQLLFSDSANTTAYMPVIGYKNGNITLSDASSTGDASTRIVQVMKSDLKVDKAFNLGIEYYVLDGGNVRIKIFIDSKLIYVSDNYYNSHKSEQPVTTSIDKMRFYSLNSANARLTIDNVVFAHDTAKYIDIDTGAK